jgi:hypothetical protein
MDTAPVSQAATPRPSRRAVGFAAALALAGLVGAGCALRPVEPAAPAPPAPAAAAAAETDPGTLGGIEVGSKGVKPLVVAFRRTPEGTEFDVRSLDDAELKEANTALGTLKTGSDREFDADRFEATAKAVERFHQRLAGHYQLPAQRVHVVVSSGVFSGFAADAAAPARAKLADRLKAATGRAPGFVDAAQEAEYAARAVVAPARRDRSLLIDIGSGNIKVGSFHPGGFRSVAVDYGTGRFQGEASKRAAEAKRPFAEVAAELREPLVGKPLREKLAAGAVAGDRTEAQLVGGAAWAAATFARPAQVRDDRVALGPDDVTRFAALARLVPADARAKVVEAVADPEARKAAGAEVERVQKVFTPEQLVAAGEILRAVFEACRLGEQKAYFFRKGQYAWIAGYLTEAAGVKD